MVMHAAGCDLHTPLQCFPHVAIVCKGNEAPLLGQRVSIEAVAAPTFYKFDQFCCTIIITTTRAHMRILRHVSTYTRIVQTLSSKLSSSAQLISNHQAMSAHAGGRGGRGWYHHTDDQQAAYTWPQVLQAKVWWRSV